MLWLIMELTASDGSLDLIIFTVQINQIRKQELREKMITKLSFKISKYTIWIPPKYFFEVCLMNSDGFTIVLCHDSNWFVFQL